VITIVQSRTAGQAFTGGPNAGLINFADLMLQSLDWVPLVNNIAFTTTALDTWLVEFVHPNGAASGRIIALNETPTQLSPGGFGGFAKMGCAITVPTANNGVVPVPWNMIFATGTLTADAQFIVSYSAGARPSGRG